MIRKIRVFGIPVLTIETDNEPAEPGDVTTTESTTVGFSLPEHEDFPTEHRKGW